MFTGYESATTVKQVILSWKEHVGYQFPEEFYTINFDNSETTRTKNEEC